MTRLIEADKLIEIANIPEAYGYVSAYEIRNAPTVDAEPVKHGHWINQGQAYNGDYLVRCSVCKRAMSEYKQIGFIRHYCPNCGAKMDEVIE